MAVVHAGLLTESVSLGEGGRGEGEEGEEGEKEKLC